VEAESMVTHGVHAVMDAMELSLAGSLRSGAAGDAHPFELPQGDNAVLP